MRRAEILSAHPDRRRPGANVACSSRCCATPATPRDLDHESAPGLRGASQASYDLILLDLQMPGMDGFQVIEALKTNAEDSYLPVLVITAQPGHKLRALQAGAKDFVKQAVRLVEVRTRIRNMLEVRLLHRKLEQHAALLEQTVRERTAELRESEARYRSLTELASDWYWEQDEHGAFSKVSGPVLEMLGMRVDALVGGKTSADLDRLGTRRERRELLARIEGRQAVPGFRVQPHQVRRVRRSASA
jgi:PAS domain S-box-containing protein